MVAAFHTLSRNPIPKTPGSETESWANHHRRFHMALLSACCRSSLRSSRKTSYVEGAIWNVSRDVKAAVKALEKYYEATAKPVYSVISRVPKIVGGRSR